MIRGKNSMFYFPLVTCLLLSVILSFVCGYWAGDRKRAEACIQTRFQQTLAPGLVVFAILTHSRLRSSVSIRDREA